MDVVRKQLLGVTITVSSKESILTCLGAYLQEGGNEKTRPVVVVTPNPEQLVLASHDTSFAAVINRADIALPDGVGIVFGLSVLFGIHTSRISGIDFFSDLVRMANKEHLTIGFVGGMNDQAHKALTTLQSSYIELHGWSEQPKEFNTSADVSVYPMDKIVRRIIDTGTRFVFVGLGAPKQEFFIDALKKQLVKHHSGPVVLMAVGGTFDVVSGSIPRAPMWMQHMGLEWLYRLFREPWRWKRQTRLLEFLFLVGKQRLFHS